MPYDLDAIRKKIKEKQAGKFSDPDEFRPEKAKSAQDPVVYRFFILPPYDLNDPIRGGPAKHSTDSQFYVTHGNHWVSDKPHPCPRVWDGTECKICSFGFELLKDEKISKDDDKRRSVVKQWMPNQQYMMNIYFPAVKQNPEDLHDRVMFYNAPKTVLDICTATLMREDPGDPENPEAFGAFFDENSAYLFELQILKQGKQNSYKTSKFLPTPRPMIRSDSGQPVTKALVKLLESRHELFSKIDLPDVEKINRVFDVIHDGDDSAGDTKKGGFDEDETGKTKAEPAGKREPGTSKVGTTTRKAPPPDDDDVVTTKKKTPPPDDDVATVKTKTTKAATTTAKTTKVDDDLSSEAPLKEDPVKSESSGTSPEIDNLLSQLDDDDD